MKQLLKNTYIAEQDRGKIEKFINDLLEFYSGSSAIEFMGSWTSVFELIELLLRDCNIFEMRIEHLIAQPLFKHRLTRAHREKQLKMSCQALHNAPPNRT